MASLPSKGAKVTWKTPQGETTGTVVKTVKSATKVKNHVAKATEDHPEVVVRSDRTGKEAVHRPEALKKA